MSIPAPALPERAVLQDIIVLLMVPVVNVRLVKKIKIPAKGLPERAVLQDTIVLLMVPVVNVRLVKKIKIPAKGIIVQAAYNAAKPDVLHMALLTALVVVALYV